MWYYCVYLHNYDGPLGVFDSQNSKRDIVNRFLLFATGTTGFIVRRTHYIIVVIFGPTRNKNVEYALNIENL